MHVKNTVHPSMGIFSPTNYRISSKISHATRLIFFIMSTMLEGYPTSIERKTDKLWQM